MERSVTVIQSEGEHLAELPPMRTLLEDQQHALNGLDPAGIRFRLLHVRRGSPAQSIEFKSSAEN
jgi:hypothetical protein